MQSNIAENTKKSILTEEDISLIRAIEEWLPEDDGEDFDVSAYAQRSTNNAV